MKKTAVLALLLCGLVFSSMSHAAGIVACHEALGIESFEILPGHELAIDQDHVEQIPEVFLKQMNSGVFQKWAAVADHYLQQFQGQLHQVRFTDGKAQPVSFLEKFILGDNTANKYMMGSMEVRFATFEKMEAAYDIPNSYRNNTIVLQSTAQLIGRMGYQKFSQLLVRFEKMGFKNVFLSSNPFPTGIALPKISLTAKTPENEAGLRVMYYLLSSERTPITAPIMSQGRNILHQYAMQGDIDSLVALYYITSSPTFGASTAFDMKDNFGMKPLSYLNPIQRAQFLWARTQLPSQDRTDENDFQARMWQIRLANAQRSAIFQPRP